MNPPQFESKVLLRDQPGTPVSPAGSVGMENGAAEGLFGRPARPGGRRSAAMIAAVYAILGSAWIFCSDALLSALVTDPRRLAVAQEIKNWGFVLGGAVLLYALIRWGSRRREHVEAALRETCENLRLIGENSADAIWIFDVAADRFTLVSPSINRLPGLTAQEMLAGQKPAVLFEGPARAAGESLPRRIAALQAGDESARVRTEYLKLPRKDGSTVFADAVTTLMTDESGRVVRVLGVVHDATCRGRVEELIAERKRAEERLQEQAAQLAGLAAEKQAQAKIREQAGLLDAANDAIYVTALDGTISYWNKGAERLFGWTPAEALSRTTAELFSRDPKTGDNQTAVLLQRGGWAGEERQRTKGGREVVVFTRLTLVRDEGREPRAVFAISSDITEKKQIEAQFLRAQRIESLGALAGGMARDLSSVLAPISNAMPSLREENLGVGARRLLDTMEESVRHGANVVRQVLIFARGVRGERIPLHAGVLLEEAAKTVRETFPGNIRVETRVADDLEMVLGDASHLREAIMNLCQNARDAMPGGGVLSLAAENLTVDENTAREAPGGKAGRHVCLSVTDEGDGIRPESLDRVFEPFFTTKTPGKGTGLGLSTVMGIARGHGGFVRVLSTVGKGSRFELFLPVTDASRSAAGANPTRSPFMHGETILVVDDEVAVCELIRRVLERQGYHVLAATGGEPALHLFEQHHDIIKIIVTDMMMPNVDGPALIRRVRQIDPATRIIAISGAGDRAMLDKIESLKLTGFLAKPFTVEMLLRLLQKILQAAPDAKG